MKKALYLVFMTLTLNPLIASADERSYNALSENIGKVFNGRNSSGHTCVAEVSDSGVSVNFNGTQLYDGIGMDWNELSKGWLSSHISYSPSKSMICEMLGAGHCEPNIQGHIEIRTDSRGILSEITYFQKNNSSVSCQF
jgi:hypothetical protein